MTVLNTVKKETSKPGLPWSTKLTLTGASIHIEELEARIRDAEIALKLYDHAGTSEYWVRYPTRDITEDPMPFFACPNCEGDLAGAGHAPTCNIAKD